MSEIRVDLVSNADDPAKRVAALERQIDMLGKSSEATNRRMAQSALAPRGSYQALEKELKDNIKELKRMEVGSKAFDVQKNKVAALQRQLAAAKGQLNAGSTAAGRFNALAGQGVAQVGQLAAGFVSMQTVVAAIIEEFAKVERNQKAAARQEQSFEAALADIGFNIGGDQIGAARQLIEENAQKLNTTQQGPANLIGVAISAGADDLQEAMAVSAAGLEATAGDSEKAVELVQTALDITDRAGSENFRGALGQVTQVQSQVRAVDPTQFFSNIAPALAAATVDRQNIDKLSTERFFELSAVVSQTLKDRQGSNSATAIRQFLGKLDSFVPKRSDTLKDGTKTNLTKEDIEQFQGTRNVDERIALLRNNENLRLQFLDQQKESVGKVAIAELVTGTETTLALENKAAAAITSIDDATAKFDELTDGVGAATVQLRAQRASEANVQALQTGDTTSTAGTVREVLATTLENVDLPGSDFIQERVAAAEIKARAEDGEGATEVALDILRRLASGEAGGFGKRELSAEEQVFVEKQIAVLERIEGELIAARRNPVPVQIPEAGPRPQPAPFEAAP